MGLLLVVDIVSVDEGGNVGVVDGVDAGVLDSLVGGSGLDVDGARLVLGGELGESVVVACSGAVVVGRALAARPWIVTEMD